MVAPEKLLDDLKRVLRNLEYDIHERAGSDAALGERLRRERAETRLMEQSGATLWREVGIEVG